MDPNCLIFWWNNSCVSKSFNVSNTMEIFLFKFNRFFALNLLSYFCQKRQVWKLIQWKGETQITRVPAVGYLLTEAKVSAGGRTLAIFGQSKTEPRSFMKRTMTMSFLKWTSLFSLLDSTRCMSPMRLIGLSMSMKPMGYPACGQGASLWKT